MLTNRAFVGVLVALFAVNCLAAPPDGKTVVLTDAGAVGDGKTLNTQAIQKAIDDLAAGGGGTIVVPQGVFLSGAIFLKPAVGLYLDKNAVLKGSTSVSDYPIMQTRVEGHFQPWLPALVNADHVDHLRIGGEGTLDGSGQPFWAAFRQRRAANPATTNLDVQRPRLVYISSCADVQISGLHLKDSGFWNLHIYNCHDVTVDGLNILSTGRGPSTDGMDIDSDQNVTIKGCTIAVGDDCIAIKGSKGPLAMEDKLSPPDEHIRITDCTFNAGGGITLGSEATIVRDVVVDHCTVSGPGTRGFSLMRFKLRPDTPQDYEDIHYSDITLDGAGTLISMAPWRQYFDLQGHAPPKSTVRNISMSDIKGSFGGFGSIAPNSGGVDTIDHITLQNINVKLTNPGFRVSGVKDLMAKDITVNGQAYMPPGATQPSP